MNTIIDEIQIMLKCIKKRHIILVVGIFLFLIVSLIFRQNRENQVKIDQENQIKSDIINEVKASAESDGLKDVIITIASEESKFGSYYVTVDCSNFENLSYDEMISLNSMFTTNAVIDNYTSNGNTYKINSYERSISKNGKEIYNDYFNSESCKSVQTAKSPSTPSSYDAKLSYNGGDSIIAIDKESLDRFLTALSNKNQGTLDELFSEKKVSKVPSGTYVNIIEKKLTVAKVKILSGSYEGNVVWTLIESIQD